MLLFFCFALFFYLPGVDMETEQVIYLFDNSLSIILNAYYVPCTLLGEWDEMMHKKKSLPVECLASRGASK